MPATRSTSKRSTPEGTSGNSDAITYAAPPMRARVGVVVSGVLLLAAVGCGGGDDGGGDLEAFCDELEAFSEDVADGDLESNRGLESLVDRVNELLELGGEEL